MNERAKLLEKVREFKYQYIIGKTVGEDLFSNGRCYAAKGDKITQQIIDQAELNNQLTWLIGEMKS